MKTIQKITLLVIITSVLFACVPAKKYEELKSKQQACAEENESLKAQNKDLEEQNKELQLSIEDLKKKQKQLEADTMVLGQSLRQMTTNYDNVNKTYQLLLDNNNELLSGNKSATEKLMKQLQVL